MVMKIYVNCILFVVLFFLLNKCGKQNNSNNKILQISSTEYLPYFLEEEIDTILSNWEKYESNSEYKNKYRQRAIRRKQEINNLKRYNVSKRNDYVPSSFKKYLLPEEIKHFNSDFISHWVVYNEIMKERRLNLMNNIKYFHFLTFKEIQEIIKDKEKDTTIYRKLALERHIKDSISSWAAYNHKKDSLQSIIHSIDSILPFGPKSLGELINKEQNQLRFTIPKKDSLTNRESILARKYIFDAWLYFLKFHPYADADLGEGYIEKSLPKINTYNYIELDGDKIEKRLGLYNEKHSIGRLAVRISNLQSLEVYYTTTGVYGSDDKCGVYDKNEGNCCFIEGYKCNSRGHLVFYNRKNQHATFIPAYELNTEWDDGLISFRFFYISKDNTIHIFEGNSRKNYQTSGHDRYYTSKSVTLSKTFEVKITEGHKFIINNVCNDIQKEEREPNTERSKMYRDSVLYSTKPIVSSYPFGSNTLINHRFPNNEFKIELTDEYYPKENPHQEALFALLKYYSKDYNLNNDYRPLPPIKKINQINIGPIEHWATPFNNQFLYSDCYIMTSEDRNRTFDFKLPDIGKYEVFFNSDPLNTHYEYFDDSQKITSNQCCLGKGGYFKMNIKGALILYNKETQTANIINAVEISNDSKQVNFRFFYINNNNQIEIYQGYGNHQGDLSNLGYVNGDFNTKGKYKLNKTQTVKVQKDGKITIIKNN